MLPHVLSNIFHFDLSVQNMVFTYAVAATDSVPNTVAMLLGFGDAVSTPERRGIVYHAVHGSFCGDALPLGREAIAFTTLLQFSEPELQKLHSDSSRSFLDFGGWGTNTAAHRSSYRCSVVASVLRGYNVVVYTNTKVDAADGAVKGAYTRVLQSPGFTAVQQPIEVICV